MSKRPSSFEKNVIQIVPQQQALQQQPPVLGGMTSETTALARQCLHIPVPVFHLKMICESLRRAHANLSQARQILQKNTGEMTENMNVLEDCTQLVRNLARENGVDA